MSNSENEWQTLSKCLPNELINVLTPPEKGKVLSVMSKSRVSVLKELKLSGRKPGSVLTQAERDQCSQESHNDNVGVT